MPNDEEDLIPDMTPEDAVDTDTPDPAALIRLLNRGKTKREQSKITPEEIARFIVERIQREKI